VSSTTGQVRSASSVTPLAATLLAMLPFLYLVWMCRRYYVDVPYGDQWELVPRLDKLQQGVLSFKDVWQQHSEHRPMFPLIIELTLASLTGWNIGAEIATNVLLAAVSFLVVARHITTQAADDVRWWWLLPPAALLFFSPIQWENWTWGWQIAIFLGSSSLLVGLFLLTRPEGGWWRLAGAVACGVVTTYSFAAGLIYWPIGAMAIALNAGQRSRGRLVCWLAAAAVTLASYFYDYHPNPGHPPMLPNFTSLQAFATFVMYILKYLGGSVASYSEPASAAVGAIGLCWFLALLVVLFPSRHDGWFMFPAVVGVATITAAILTASGRAGFGSSQGMASRYTTLSLPLWVSILLLTGGLLARRRMASGSGAMVALVAVGLVCGSAAVTCRTGADFALVRFQLLRGTMLPLYDGQDDGVLRRLYSNVETLKARRLVLQRLHMSVFRKDARRSGP